MHLKVDIFSGSRFCEFFIICKILSPKSPKPFTEAFRFWKCVSLEIFSNLNYPDSLPFKAVKSLPNVFSIHFQHYNKNSWCRPFKSFVEIWHLIKFIPTFSHISAFDRFCIKTNAVEILVFWKICVPDNLCSRIFLLPLSTKTVLTLALCQVTNVH